jgi:hypothetical protein
MTHTQPCLTRQKKRFSHKPETTETSKNDTDDKSQRNEMKGFNQLLLQLLIPVTNQGSKENITPTFSKSDHCLKKNKKILISLSLTLIALNIKRPYYY